MWSSACIWMRRTNRGETGDPLSLFGLDPRCRGGVKVDPLSLGHRPEAFTFWDSTTPIRPGRGRGPRLLMSAPPAGRGVLAAVRLEPGVTGLAPSPAPCPLARLLQGVDGRTQDEDDHYDHYGDFHGRPLGSAWYPPCHVNVTDARLNPAHLDHTTPNGSDPEMPIYLHERGQDTMRLRGGELTPSQAR